MAYSYYIYYRVTPENAAKCEARALELIAAVREATSVAGRLLKKRSEPLLWMEVVGSPGTELEFAL